MVLRIVLAFFALMFQFEALFADHSEVLQRAKLLPMNLDSCELEYANQVSHFEPRKLAVDGDKFFLDTGRLKKTIGFDGRQHWAKQNDGKGALVSKVRVASSIQLDLHPLILPYTWFWEDISQGKWSDLRSGDMWDSAIERLRPLDEREIRGTKCYFYEVTYSSDNSHVVAFVGDGFPLQVESKKNGAFSKLEILNFVKDSTGAVVGTEFLKTRTDNSQWRLIVNAKSLKFNQKVDPALFSFDPAGVQEIIDIDKQHRTQETAVGRSGSRWWILTVLAIGIGGLIVYKILASRGS